MGVDPSATAMDVIRALAEKIELQNVDGWALYEVSATTWRAALCLTVLSPVLTPPSR